MQFKLRLVSAAAVALMLVACGGDSSNPSSATSGIAVDGYLRGATVYCGVVGANSQADAATDSGGKFTFSHGCRSDLIVTGGINADTERSFTGVLKAPAGATVVSPLSTLMAAGLSQEKLNSMLGLPFGTDVLHTDPAKLDGGTYDNPALQKSNLIVQQLIQTTAQNIAALATGTLVTDKNAINIIYTEVAAAFAANLGSGVNPLIAVATDGTMTVTKEVVTAMMAGAASRVSTSGAEISPEIKTALAPIDAAASLANATSAPVTALAQSYAAATTFVEMKEATLVAQSNNSIATALTDVLKDGALSLSQLDEASGQSALTVAIAEATAQLPDPHVTTTTTTTTTTSTATGTSTTSTAAGTSTTSTAAATTTTSSTTTTTLAPSYLYLAGDTISFDNGSGATAYTMAEFQSESGGGIEVKWPMANTAAIKFTLANAGNFTVAAGQTVSAALSITDTAGSGAQIKAYIDGVALSKSGSTVTVTVPSTANARVYGKAADGTEGKASFADTVAGVFNALDTSGTAVSSFQIGGIINDAINRVGTVSNLNGKYLVTLVVSNLALARADGSALSTFSVSVPDLNGTVKQVTGTGLEGYMTIVNATPATTTTTTTATPTTTTTTATTTSTTLSPLPNYLSLANNTISFDSGFSTTDYTMAAFQTGAGIAVKWPMADAAAIKFTLTDAGGFTVAAGQKLSAAVSIVDTASGGLGLVKAFIDTVNISKTGTDITVSVPSTALARVYARAADGSEVMSGFADSVSGVFNTLSTANNAVNSIVLGKVINSALARVGTMGNLSGRYEVTLVVKNLSLRQADGTPFTSYTVEVPGSLSGTTAATSITGSGLKGFITLAP